MKSKNHSVLIFTIACLFSFAIGNASTYFLTTPSYASSPYNEVQEEDMEVVNDSILFYRNQAEKFIDSFQAIDAIEAAKEYIRRSEDLSIINDHFFSNIEHTDPYQNFKIRYQSQFDFLSLFYLFSGCLGLFLCVMLNLKKGIKRSSTLLMSVFVLLHSVFIVHLSLYLINCQYNFPNALLLSTSFTLLYGPLIYLYFRINITNYKPDWKDLIHLVPALLLIVYILPYYTLTGHDKFLILFDQQDVLVSEAKFIIGAKFLSLLIYGVFTFKLYNENYKKTKEKSNELLWQRNIIAIYIIYTVIFILYTSTTSGYFDSPMFFHLQILVMVGLVFYVAYITYVQPEIFKGQVKIVDPVKLFKYKTSNLTPSYSNELRDHLLKILNEDKIYKEEGVSLNMLSERLGTSRHNTSQIINEHFDMNFFELMNKYRIDEAVELIKNRGDEKLNIIDIAYKVGFNNKVTFNKAFKKRFEVTPTQYIKSLED